MVYVTRIPIIKPNIYTHQFRRRPVYTHQNGNINPTSCTLMMFLLGRVFATWDREGTSFSQPQTVGLGFRV